MLDLEDWDEERRELERAAEVRALRGAAIARIKAMTADEIEELRNEATND